MPPTHPRGTARGRPLTGPRGAATAGNDDFRCSVAAESRSDELAGTATHLAAFLLIEHHGPWGASAPRDSRLPEVVRKHLAAAPRSVRVLLTRRHHRAHRGEVYRMFLAVPHRSLLLTSTFTDLEELLALDLEGIAHGRHPDWAAAPGPFYGVCTHGRHDVCCAERGRPVAAALCTVREEQTWEVTHIGGDRFSANMVVLPEGLYYGHLDAESVIEVAELHESGRLDLDRLRGRSTMPMLAQYAEIALARHLGDDRVDALRLERRDGGTCVFRHGEQRYAVTVRRRLSEKAERLTCSAERLNPMPVHELVAIERI